jgi:hypothetical protein
MDRVDIETGLLQQIHGLPDEQLVELSEFVTVLSNRLPPQNVEKKLSFVEFIRRSPLCDVELELDRRG